MTGKQLKDKIKASKFPQNKVAEMLGITPQDLTSKLKAQSVKAEFLARVLNVINESVSPENTTPERVATQREAAPVEDYRELAEAWKAAARANEKTVAAQEKVIELYEKLEKAATAYVSRERFGELQGQFFGVQNMTVKYLSQLTGIPTADLLVESRKVLRAQAQTQNTSSQPDKGR